MTADDPAGSHGEEGARTDPPAPDGFSEAVGHLQEAALAMVAAARAAVDAAEHLTRNPAPLLDLLATVAEAAQRARSPAGGAGEPDPGGAGPPPASGGRRVERVPVTPAPGSAEPGGTGADDGPAGSERDRADQDPA